MKAIINKLIQPQQWAQVGPVKVINSNDRPLMFGWNAKSAAIVIVIPQMSEDIVSKPVTGKRKKSAQ